MHKRILVPVDLGDLESADRALDTAENFATNNNAEIHALTVVPTYSMAIVGSFFPADFEKKALQEAQNALAGFLANRDGKSAVEAHVAHGTIYDKILATANKLECDLIVLTSHRPELQD